MEKDHIKIQDSTYLLHCLWGKYSGIWDSFRLFFMQTKKAALCIMLAVDLVYFFSAGFPPPQRLRRGVTSRFAGEDAKNVIPLCPAGLPSCQEQRRLVVWFSSALSQQAPDFEKIGEI